MNMFEWLVAIFFLGPLVASTVFMVFWIAIPDYLSWRRLSDEEKMWHRICDMH